MNEAFPPLVGDPDHPFLRSLLSRLQPDEIAPVVGTTAQEIEKALGSTELTFSGIFINPGLADPSGIPVLRVARKLRPNTPIFYIDDGDSPPLSTEQLRGLTVARVVRKPFTYADLTHAIRAAGLAFDSGAALQQAARNLDALGVETSATEEEFVPILARNFIAGSASFFDVYVRLTASKFIKVLKAGDGFPPERLTNYINKGVTHFFLRQEAQEQYLRYCEKLTHHIIQARNVPTDLKVSQVMNHGQETANLLRQSGLSESAVLYAEKYVENVRELVKSLRLEKNDAVRSYLDHVALVDHGAATTLVASLLAAPLKLEAERSISLVGLGAFFHDIGLQGMDPSFLAEAEESMDPDQLVEFHKHPKRGAEMLINLHAISPTVLQAITQHHERRNRRGFPDRLGSGAINRVAEIIGISEEFVRLLHQQRSDPRLNPFQHMEQRVFDGFSTPVIAAFRLAFPPPKG